MTAPDLAHLRFTADAVQCFADQGDGTWWWWDPTDGDTGELLTSNTRDAPSDDALYLMQWDASWIGQWSGDWQAAAEWLNEFVLIDTTTPDLYG